jgi:hypothetical protein
MSDSFEDLEETIDRLDSQLGRHRRIIEAIIEEPDKYSEELVDEYADEAIEHLGGTNLFEGLESTVDKLESRVDSAEAAALASIELVVDDRTIEGVDIDEFSPDDDPPSAVAFVPSPKVNQVRGGRQQLVTAEGQRYDFQITQTLVADMEEDKTGTLKLVLELTPTD